MDIRTLATTLCLCLSVPLAAQASTSDQGIGQEIRQELEDARKEVRVELAKARKDLETENLRIDDGVHVGRRGQAKPEDRPRAEITPQGDLLIDGKAQPLDAAQRRQVLAYRQQVIRIAFDGIATGQKAAEAALDAVGDSWLGILFNAMTGRLEHRVERVVMEQVQPMVLGICRQLPALRDAQQKLAITVPSFRPYATLQQRDIDDCEGEIRNEFAKR